MTTWQTATGIYKLRCCTDGGANCQHKDGSPECHAVMKEVCKMPQHGGMQYCKDWAIKYPAVAESTVRQYCVDGNRFSDPWCACILSKAKTAGGQLNPVCVDQRCMSTAAFKPFSLTSVACPDEINCTQIVTMKNIGISVAPSIETSSNCGGQNPGEPKKAGAGWLILIIIFVAVLAITVAVSVILIRRQANNNT